MIQGKQGCKDVNLKRYTTSLATREGGENREGCARIVLMQAKLHMTKRVLKMLTFWGLYRWIRCKSFGVECM